MVRHAELDVREIGDERLVHEMQQPHKGFCVREDKGVPAGKFGDAVEGVLHPAADQEASGNALFIRPEEYPAPVLQRLLPLQVLVEDLPQTGEVGVPTGFRVNFRQWA